MTLTVPTYPKRDDVGGGAMLALHAVLWELGAQVGYEELLVMSGAAFSFVYDNAPVFEPLRDLLPLDVLRLGTASSGFNGRWIIDKPAGETLKQIGEAVAAGRPAVVSLYSYDHELHGYSVAVAYHPAGNRLSLQTDKVHQVTLPDTWWGAVPGPVAWAACPAFVIDPGRPAGWSRDARLYRALARAEALLEGGCIPYRDCEGVREYTRVPLAGRQAAYGQPAYERLAADVAGSELLGDFSLIWRLDAQLSQLHHYRSAAAAYLHTVPHPIAPEADATALEVSDRAEALASRFWYKPTRSLTTAADVMAAAAGAGALVLALGLPEDELARLAERMPVCKTVWGPVAIVDSTPRRRDALALVRQMRDSDARLGRLLADLRDSL